MNSKNRVTFLIMFAAALAVSCGRAGDSVGGGDGDSDGDGGSSVIDDGSGGNDDGTGGDSDPGTGGAAASGGLNGSGGLGESGGAAPGGMAGEGGALIQAGDPPSIFIISDIGTTPGAPFAPFLVHFYDDFTAASDLLITIESSDEGFLPLSGIVFGEIQNEGDPDEGHFYRELSLTPTTLTEGSSTVTITVTDEADQQSSRSFDVLINAELLNDAEAVSVSGGEEPQLGSNLSYSGHPSLGEDGNLVAFESSANNFGFGGSASLDIYLRNRSEKTTTRITGGLGTNERPTITPDGRYVAFYSNYALAAGDTNGAFDCYLFDTDDSSFEQISIADDESQADGPSLPGQFENSRPAISDDGRYVAFVSSATNLVSGDTNGKVDVFVRDRTSDTTTRVSVSTSGVQGDEDSGQPTISGDGSVIAFSSLAKTLQDGVTDTDSRLDVYVRVGGETQRISSANGTFDAANGFSDAPALSGDGLYLAFSSAATNLGSTIEFFGHVDIWLYSLDDETFLRINTDLGTNGTQGYCSGPQLSEDGQRVVFTGQGTIGDYLSDDPLTYTYDVEAGMVDIVSLNNVGSVPNGGTGYNSVISRDGFVVGFQTAASDIVFADTNTASDVFVVPF